MKLAEALADRADAVRRVEQLRARVAASARYQEGEEPAEDAVALLAELREVLDRLEGLIRRINTTNVRAHLESGESLTEGLARRDVLRMRHSAITSAADAASGRNQLSMARQLRSELRVLSALPVAELHAEADALARDLRGLDVRIQRTNWEVDVDE